MALNNEKLKSLVDITYSIYSLYKKLFTLDDMGLKDSDDYRQYLGYLKMMIGYENEKIASFTDEELILFSNDFECQDKEIEYRIKGKLFERIMNLTKLFSEIMNSDDRAIKIKCLDNYPEDVCAKIIKSIKGDVLNTFISFLKDALETFKRTEAHSKLLYKYYFLAFVKSEIEQVELKRGFSFEREVQLESIITAQLNGINESDYNIARDEVVMNQFIVTIEDLLEIEDYMLVDSENLERLIHGEAALKTCFALASKGLIAAMKTYWEKRKTICNPEECLEAYMVIEKEFSTCKIAKSIILAVSFNIVPC